MKKDEEDCLTELVEGLKLRRQLFKRLIGESREALKLLGFAFYMGRRNAESLDCIVITLALLPRNDY